MIRMTVTGERELIRALGRLPAALRTSVQGEALRAGAVPLQEEAARRAPRSQRRGPHLADNIAIGAPHLVGGMVTVYVGPERRPDNVFYGWFQEFGTSHHAPQPFMRPAFYSRAGLAASIVLAFLWSAVRRVAVGR